MSAIEELQTKLQAAPRAPFLFVGAGLSKRYLRVDGWVDLLRRMAQLTTRPYAFYATKANNDLSSVASAIAADFHEIWWTTEAFAEARDVYGERLSSLEGPLKVEVSRYTTEALANLPGEGSLESQELDLLRNAVIDGAVTTNYDGLLELLFPEYWPYVGQDQMLFASTQGIGEIYKIHGSAEDPESLVLTRADYDRFAERNPYLAAKLLTIFVEHPVIFLGYSLNDPDVTAIILSVARVLTTDNLAKLQGQLIFVQWDPGASVPTLVATQIAAGGFTIPILQLTVSSFVGLFTALGAVQRKFPAQLLRQLKGHVYDLVYSTDPNSQLSVIDIDSTTDISTLEVVFGVGLMSRMSRQGYVGLKRADVLRDVLAPRSEYEPSRMVDEALPVILRQPGHIPLFRYLREAGKLRDDGSLAPNADVDDRIVTRVSLGRSKLGPGQAATRAARLVTEAGEDFETLAAANSLIDTLLAVLVMPDASIDLEAFRVYLLDHADDAAAGVAAGLPTAWGKAVCLYDYLKFAKLPATP